MAKGFLISGYGRMGKLVHKVLRERGAHIWGVIEPDGDKLRDPNIAGAIAEFQIKHVGIGDILAPYARTAICFTDPDTEYETTKRLLEGGIDAIVGTTKWFLKPDKTVDEAMIAELGDLAKQHDCRFVYAPNFSIGVNVFWQNLKQLAPVMAKFGYDVAVVEEHHTGKKDVSGTAITIGNILLDAYPNKTRLKIEGHDKKIAPDEISIAVVRAGDTPGTHRVIFDSPVDRFELVHVVRDREIFAKGAVETAYWAREQPAGGYCITDRLK